MDTRDNKHAKGPEAIGLGNGWQPTLFGSVLVEKGEINSMITDTLSKATKSAQEVSTPIVDEKNTEKAITLVPMPKPRHLNRKQCSEELTHTLAKGA